MRQETLIQNELYYVGTKEYVIEATSKVYFPVKGFA